MELNKPTQIKRCLKLIFISIKFFLFSFGVFLTSNVRAQSLKSEVIFSTYYGDVGTDDADVVAVDPMGHVYLGCHSDSKDLPGSNIHPYKMAGGMDAFIVKLSNSGKEVAYIAQLGGKKWDAVQGIIADSLSNIYAVGTTYSSNFSVTKNGFQKKFGGKSDAFVVKLDQEGAVLWSTYLGGKEDEDGRGIAFDKQGNIHIIGRTASTDFPVTEDAIQSQSAGGIDAFVTSFDPDGHVLNSTYFGGSGDDIGHSIVIDRGDQIYFGGTTNSNDLPMVNPFQGEIKAEKDIFFARIAKDRSSIDFASYWGGEDEDQLYGLDIDEGGNLFAMGVTYSLDFPTTNGTFQETHGGESDTFVSKFNIEQGEIKFSTFLGGTEFDDPRNLALSQNGQAYIVGKTTSHDFPIVDTEKRAGKSDAFIALLKSNGSDLLYACLEGGNAIETFEGIAIGKDGSLTVSGLSNSIDFPLANAIQESFLGGRFDIVVARFMFTDE